MTGPGKRRSASRRACCRPVHVPWVMSHIQGGTRGLAALVSPSRVCYTVITVTANRLTGPSPHTFTNRWIWGTYYSPYWHQKRIKM